MSLNLQQRVDVINRLKKGDSVDEEEKDQHHSDGDVVERKLTYPEAIDHASKLSQLMMQYHGEHYEALANVTADLNLYCYF